MTSIWAAGVAGLFYLLSGRRLQLVSHRRIVALALVLPLLFTIALALVAASGGSLLGFRIRAVPTGGGSWLLIHVPAVTITLGDSDTFQFVVIGLVAAVIAGQVIGHTAGFFLALLIGILGAFLGRWLVQAANVPVGRGLIPQLVTALIGALVLMAVARAFGDKLVGSESEDQPTRLQVKGGSVDPDRGVAWLAWTGLAILAIGSAMAEAYRRRRRRAA